MDAIVEAALRKWPNVPHCHGWLGLDARGHWYLRDEQAQAAGAFAAARGSRIEHVGLREFIHRNYACDASGCWYFQNGPQRVYVELERTPWVWRLARQGGSVGSGPVGIESHTGLSARLDTGFVDETGRLYLATDLGLGLVHSLDVELASQAMADQGWPVVEAAWSELVKRYGLVLSPAAARLGVTR